MTLYKNALLSHGLFFAGVSKTKVFFFRVNLKMETIKKKINALKEDNEVKQEEIERLQEKS